MTHRPWQKLGLLALLGVAIHLILPQITALEHSWQVLKTLAPWAVGLAFLSQVWSYLGSGNLLGSPSADADPYVVDYFIVPASVACHGNRSIRSRA